MIKSQSMLTDEALKAIEDRVRAATPGPWVAVFNEAIRGAWAMVKAGTNRVIQVASR
jgi:hypothetical protein